MYFCRMIPLSLLLSLAFAYECPEPGSVAISVKNSTAVFSGEVNAEEYRDVKADSMGEPRQAKALPENRRVRLSVMAKPHQRVERVALIHGCLDELLKRNVSRTSS